MKLRKIELVALFMFIQATCWISQVNGGTIFSRHWSADDLWALSESGTDVFPSERVVSLESTDGVNRLRFADNVTDQTHSDILIFLPLVDADVLRTDATVTITIHSMPIGSHNASDPDNDLAIGVADGSHMIGFARHDNANGTGNVQWGTYSDKFMADYHYYTLYTNASMPEEFNTTLTLSSAETDVDGAIGASSGAYSISSPWCLDASGTLSLAVWGGNWGEYYDVGWIEVTVSSSSVPEPTSFMLWTAIGMTGLVFARRTKTARRKKKEH